MKFKEKLDKDGLKLVVKMDSDEYLDVIELSRINNIGIRYFVEINDFEPKKAVFNVGDKKSLEEYLLEPKDIVSVKKFLDQIIRLFEFLMVNNVFFSNLHLDKNQIWIDDNDDLSFLYLPTEGEIINKYIIDLVLYYLKRVKPADENTNKFIIAVKKEIVTLRFLDPGKFEKTLERLYRENNNTHIKKITNECYKDAEIQIVDLDCISLLRVATGEIISVGNEKLILGKGKELFKEKTGFYKLDGNDYFSDIHVRVERNENGILLEDLNSTNGSYAKDVRLLPKTPITLLEGESFFIANEEFKVGKNK
ncbi:FHA domain-containing protein [Eubacteriales bacterium KG127]